MDSKYTSYIIKIALIGCGIALVVINLLTFFEGMAHEGNILAWHIVLSTLQTVVLLFIALQWSSHRHPWVFGFFAGFITPEIVRLLLLWSNHSTLAGRTILGAANVMALSVTFICFILLSSIILQIVKRMNIFRQRMEYKRQLLTKLIDTLPVAISVGLRDGKRPVFNRAAQHSAEKRDGIFAVQEGYISNFTQRLWQELDEHALEDNVLGKLFHHNKVSNDAYQLYDVGYGLLDVPARDLQSMEKHDHLFVYAIDISEREKLIHDLKQSQQEAQAANEAKTRFLANVSHELRTPITSIVGFAQYLSYQENLDEDVLESVGLIAESGETLLQLVNDILDLSKAESHKLVDNAAKVDVHSLIYDEIQMMHEKITEKKLELRTLLSFDLPEQIVIDAGKIKQVLRNLLSNAYKFTQQGTIAITVWSSDIMTWKHSQSASFDRATLLDCLSIAQEYPPQHSDEIVLHIDVSDTGVGIAAEELEHIFEPFVQSQSGRESTGGTGLGLAICKQLTEFLGGGIIINSAPYKGTRCYFHVRAKRATIQRDLEDVGIYLAG